MWDASGIPILVLISHLLREVLSYSLFLWLFDVSKTFKTLKDHLKRVEDVQMAQERGHMPFRRRPTRRKLQLVFWNACPGRVWWLRVGVFEEDGLISHCEALWKEKDILSSALTFYTSCIIFGWVKSLLQCSQVQELIAVIPPYLFFMIET